MINGESGGDGVNGGGVAKPTPPPTLPKSYTPSAAAAYRLASMERLAQRQRIFEQGGPPPPSSTATAATTVTTTTAASDDHQHHQSSPAGPPPPVTAPKPVLGTKASLFLLYVFPGRAPHSIFCCAGLGLSYGP